MKSYLKDHMTDELSQIEELKKWCLMAGDGKKNEHDMKMLKHQDLEKLKRGLLLGAPPCYPLS